MFTTHRAGLSLAALFALGKLAVSPLAAQISAPPNAINFQGRLTTPSGNPVPDGTYNLRIRFYDAATGGTVKHDQTFTNTPVKNGIIGVLIGLFTADKFDGNTWIGIGINGATELAPRQQIVSVPYAIKSNLALTVADGSITASKFASGVLNANAWLLGGNSATNPATQFLGTTDNQPLTLKVNNHRVMQYQYIETTYGSVNVLGGSEINSISAGVVGATIAGGGLDSFTGTDAPNRITADFGTVGGGNANTASGTYATVAGGRGNIASNLYATVGGGASNTAGGQQATVGGGAFNIASNLYATVGGGASNTASGQYSTVAGGYSHIASGFSATVAGGYDNTAAGDYSFAAGRRARANHAGSFVWADSANADFASDAPNTFNVRAASGVNLYANTDVFGILHSVTLYVDTLPFGDYRNVQWDSVTKQFFYDNSSRKHKRNITPLEDDFDKLLQAVPVTYTRPNAPGRWEIGFIAEDFHDLGLKRLVDYSDKGEVEGINYEKICLYLTAIAKKQNDRLNMQEKDNTAKDAKIAELKARLDALTEAVAKLQAKQK